jgi:hypothetical protein
MNESVSMEENTPSLGIDGHDFEVIDFCRKAEDQ